jgi:anti-sigma factor (TIGR02949 family)
MPLIDRVTCADLIRGLPAFLDGEVSAKEADALAAHLDACAHCLATYQFERRLLNEVKAKVRTTDVPTGLARRIAALIERETRG